MNTTELEGIIDLHIHSAPDVIQRLMDDLEVAREASFAGMRAILLKSHHTLTADRAAIASEKVESIDVFGGLVLNHAVGGLNPYAVEAALGMGAKEIWMPTLSAVNHLRRSKTKEEGISILDENRGIKPVVYEILGLIAQVDIILGSGHLSVEETVRLVNAAKDIGVKKILITHPELPAVNMPIAVQEELGILGAFFERCFYTVITPEIDVNMITIARAVKRVGVERNVISTDLGQVGNPSPVEGMHSFIRGLREVGVSEAEVDMMTREVPARLLGLA